MDFSVIEDCFHNGIITVRMTEEDLLGLIEGKTLEARFTNPKLFVLRVSSSDMAPQYETDVSSSFQI